MINFQKGKVIRLKAVSSDTVMKEAAKLLMPDEYIAACFRTVRDHLIFTNKRLISIDVQGLTGTRRSYSTMPYKMVQFFTVQTPGLVELVPDAEMVLHFANGYVCTFQFHANVNIMELQRLISQGAC